MTITETQLSNELALVQRLVIGKRAPLEFWRWLSDRRPQAIAVPSNWSRPELAAALSEIIDPLLADAKPGDRSRHVGSAEMIASMFQFIATHADERRWTFANRMLAASLMPLYRSLATGDLAEALQQTRLTLCDSLTLVGLVYEFGDELDQLLERDACLGKAPHECLQSTLNLQIGRIARLTLYVANNWDHSDHRQLVDLVESAETQSRTTRAAAWASPSALWRLSGELMSKKAEFVMPREWINVPIPWSSVSEHWSSLELVLTSASPRIVEQRPAFETRESRSAGWSDSNRKKGPPDNAIAHSPWGPNSEGTVGTDFRVDATSPLDDLVPKIILGEVRSHNDPVFTNLVSRQLSTCRAEDRSVSLLAVRVEPEEEQDRRQLSASCDNGLVRWQQNLVNWLADQPEVFEPYAFTCTEGELILCLLDIERNSATSLLRQGLVEVLTGKRIPDEAAVSLARVHIPARYHAGIASVSSPGSSFAAQQLISATYRCLEAAQRHGKAAIKSIEVF